MTVLEWLGGLVALALGFLATSRSLERSLGKRIDDLNAKVEQVRAEGEKAHATIGQAIRETEKRIVKMLGKRIDDQGKRIEDQGKRIEDLKDYLGDRIQDLREVTSERIQDLKEVLASRR